MNVSRIPEWEAYDFTESTVLDVKWARNFRDVHLTIDYFWDLADPERRKAADRSQPVLVQLIGCVWTLFNTGRDFCESEVEYAPEIVTVIGWSVDSDTKNLADMPHLLDAVRAGYHYVYFASSHNPGELWMQVVCQDIVVMVL